MSRARPAQHPTSSTPAMWVVAPKTASRHMAVLRIHFVSFYKHVRSTIAEPQLRLITAHSEPEQRFAVPLERGATLGYDRFIGALASVVLATCAEPDDGRATVSEQPRRAVA